jgi:hypothetical protein
VGAVEDILERFVQVKTTKGFDWMKIKTIPDSKDPVIGMSRKIFTNLREGEKIEKWVQVWLSQYFKVEEEGDWWKLTRK